MSSGFCKPSTAFQASQLALSLILNIPGQPAKRQKIKVSKFCLAKNENNESEDIKEHILVFTGPTVAC